MEAEHCSKGDSKIHFVTGNYNINTCPSNEWAITVLHDVTGADLRHGRSLVTIEENMKKEIVAIGKLTRFEVIAVVLYTGPMVSWTDTLFWLCFFRFCFLRNPLESVVCI
jgi:hypothetical protein